MSPTTEAILSVAFVMVPGFLLLIAIAVWGERRWGP